MEDQLSWEALEHHHDEKSADWYWSLGIVAVSIAILCVVFGNVLLGIFVVLAAFTAGLHAGRHPHTIQVSLTSKGLIAHNKLYRYDSLDSFWIEEELYHVPQIIFKSKKLSMPFIIIPIEGVHHDEVRMYLLMHLKEKEHHESVLHRVLEYFGF